VTPPRDGYLYRPLARPLTRLLSATPLSANGVTLAGAAVGVAGGWLIGSPDGAAVLAGIAALVVSGTLDCCDGELARLRGAASRLGRALDVCADTVVGGALLAGVVRRLARSGAAPDPMLLLALAVGILAAFAVVTWSEATEPRRRRVARWENDVLDGVLARLTTRDWHVVPIAFALAGRLDRLVPAAAVGAHVFWVVALVLLLRARRAAQLQGSAARVRQ
jgi:phosphatidylglycerophosphate synthase